MKYIEKSTAPNVFQNYVNKNSNNSGKTGTEIWDKFRRNSTRKIDLHNSLLKEQGYLCAYCGKKIGKEGTDTFSVDHNETKENRPDLTLVYSNLLGCCKMSQPQVVNLEDIKCSPKTLINIASELNIDIEDFSDRKNICDTDDLEQLGKTKIQYNRGISLHCDDGKEIRLIKIGWQAETESVEKYIINPTKDMDCETYFNYITDETGIFCEIKEIENLPNTQKAKNTIAVFELNTEYLRKKRTDAVEKAKKLRNDMEKFNLENEDILEEIYSKEDGKLTPYCFVTASVFRTLV